MRGLPESAGLRLLRDFEAVRGFLGGQGPGAMFDLPWMPVHPAICTLIGLAVFAGSLVLIIFTFATDRMFAPFGGVMRHVQEQRVTAAYAALPDVLETHSLTQIASDLGFGSSSLFSRTFHERFGLSPSAFRQAVGQAAEETRPPSLDPVQAWWARLGQ